MRLEMINSQRAKYKFILITKKQLYNVCFDNNLEIKFLSIV